MGVKQSEGFYMMIQPHVLVIIHIFILYDTVYPFKHIYNRKDPTSYNKLVDRGYQDYMDGTMSGEDNEEKTKSCVADKAEAIVAYKECMDRHHETCAAEASTCTTRTHNNQNKNLIITTPKPTITVTKTCTNCEKFFRTSTVGQEDLDAYFKQ